MWSNPFWMKRTKLKNIVFPIIYRKDRPPSLDNFNRRGMFRKEDTYDQNDGILSAKIENKELALTEELRGEELILVDGSKY